MLKELILANPIISLILVVVPTAGVVWKVLHVLYVKPRDFRINTMEKDIDVLRNEILKIEKRQYTPSDNIGKVKASESEISPTKDTEEAKSANISGLSGELVLNDLQDLLDIWNNKELTDLQKKHIEETYENKSVVWEVVLKSVGEVKDGKIYVSVVSPRAEFQLDNAVAYFDESYKEALLMVKKGESVIISGTIERFFLSPMLKDCKIVRK
ncbi:MAG: hypothetical protein VX447_02585 [Pseudomonadota bacterium]|uniref:hypothetical protein n=1 Tax=Gallaecimonas pentaromativorans TaxID=584787 RepID=UPI00067E9026|nr:hypothetical protein [Gallaecimonas pentaromativorans]MED5523632.1 hypothetical protein [Pseudomonadota bacterium]